MCQEFCWTRSRGENNDNENNDNEAKKCYREALYLDPGALAAAMESMADGQCVGGSEPAWNTFTHGWSNPSQNDVLRDLINLMNVSKAEDALDNIYSYSLSYSYYGGNCVSGVQCTFYDILAHYADGIFTNTYYYGTSGVAGR